MINSLETQKARIKRELCEHIDEYCEEFSKRSDGPNFTIDEIEQLMLRQQKKVREALTGLNSEMTGGIEMDEKKMP